MKPRTKPPTGIMYYLTRPIWTYLSILTNTTIALYLLLWQPYNWMTPITLTASIFFLTTTIPILIARIQGEYDGL